MNSFGLLFANAKGKPITSCYVRRDVLHPPREKLGIPRWKSFYGVLRRTQKLTAEDKLSGWRPRRDLNPCYRRESITLECK